MYFIKSILYASRNTIEKNRFSITVLLGCHTHHSSAMAHMLFPYIIGLIQQLPPPILRLGFPILSMFPLFFYIAWTHSLHLSEIFPFSFFLMDYILSLMLFPLLPKCMYSINSVSPILQESHISINSYEIGRES